MYTKTEKKILCIVDKEIDGVIFSIKKITPGDCLDKEGIPVSKWEQESNRFFSKQKEAEISLKEVQKQWKRLFGKAVVSIDGQTEKLSELIDKVISNLSISQQLYSFILSHCFGIKKKSWIPSIFIRSKP